MTSTADPREELRARIAAIVAAIPESDVLHLTHADMAIDAAGLEAEGEWDAIKTASEKLWDVPDSDQQVEMEEAVCCALPANLRGVANNLSDAWSANLCSIEDAAFLLGLELGRRQARALTAGRQQ